MKISTLSNADAFLIKNTTKEFQAIAAAIPATGQKPVGDPPGFNTFMAMTIQLERDERRNENMNRYDAQGRALPPLWSKYGVMETTIPYYIKDPELAQVLISKLQDDSFDEADARTFYKAMLNASRYAEIYRQDQFFGLVYADAVTNQGLGAANAFYDMVKKQGGSVQDFIAMRNAAAMGQSFIPAKYRKQANPNYFESWINRTDRVEEAFTGRDVNTSFRELLLDCNSEAQLNTIAQEWNVDPAFLKDINPNYLKTRQIRVPTYAHKLHGEQIIRRTAGNEAQVLKTVAREYGLSSWQLRTFTRTDEWRQKLRIQLPITGISVNSPNFRAFLNAHPDAMQAEGSDYVFAVEDFTRGTSTQKPQAYAQDDVELTAGELNSIYHLDSLKNQPETTLEIPEVRKDYYDENHVLHHYVRKGETLYKLSRDYGVSVADLMQKNGLQSTAIHIGQDLIVQSSGQ